MHKETFEGIKGESQKP